MYNVCEVIATTVYVYNYYYHLLLKSMSTLSHICFYGIKSLYYLMFARHQNFGCIHSQMVLINLYIIQKLIQVPYSYCYKPVCSRIPVTMNRRSDERRYIVKQALLIMYRYCNWDLTKSYC